MFGMIHSRLHNSQQLPEMELQSLLIQAELVVTKLTKFPKIPHQIVYYFASVAPFPYIIRKFLALFHINYIVLTRKHSINCKYKQI